MAANYPIVRLTNHATGAILSCRTANHSTMELATGAATVSTSVTIPSSASPGAYTMVVIANGIPSAGFPVAVFIKIKEKFEELEKSEKFEHKELKVEKIEIKEIERPIFQTKLKDAETVETQQQVGDPRSCRPFGT